MSPSSLTSLTSSSLVVSDGPPAEVVGSTTPRLCTPPLRELTPETSYGFDLIDFARDVCGITFDPWQDFAAIHLGELLEDGRPRFRTVLILVARQNGKTELAKCLILYWLFMDKKRFVLGTGADRRQAKRTWQRICAMAKRNPLLRKRLGRDAIRLTISEEALTTLDGAEYGFSANNSNAARGETLFAWLLDELRQHKNTDAWDAAYNAMNAVEDAQVVAISNQGDDSAALLDALRTAALTYIETGEGDERLGLIEWSAPPGADPTDPRALAAANPSLGLDRPLAIRLDSIRGAALRAKAAGGIALAKFRTEVLCQRVALLDPAIDPDLWLARAVDRKDALDLAQHRDKVALCLDVSLDSSHAVLIAAAEVDGKVHVDVVKAWSGFGCLKAVRADLPGIVAKIRPRVIGWFPMGPAALLAADMQEKRAAGWPPRRVKIVAISNDTASVCMALPMLVETGEVVHIGDPMLTAHVNSAQKLHTGPRWVYTRTAAAPVNGAYALAGAVHLARTLPPAPPPLSVA